MGRPLDTSVEARVRQLDAYRAMTPAQRLRLADEMTADARSMTRAGIRARAGGQLDEADVAAELARRVLGRERRAGANERRSTGPP